MAEANVSEAGTKRGRDRVRTFLKAVIEFNNGAAKIDCTVKNISPTGARLDVTSAVSLPNEFSLSIPHRGEVLRVQLVWREKEAIGVRFIGANAVSSTPLAAAASTRSLEQAENENMRLRRRIKELSRRLEALGQDPNVDEMP